MEVFKGLEAPMSILTTAKTAYPRYYLALMSSALAKPIAVNF
jgi:hypothetical protein